ncbi:SGNH/GDSL hydrolase family protein [Aurantiacibacter sediminis]|uniref:SGNH hydrolase-type esterase domain-containing protein n=1 Tax=Aurantiacibacter sediminis TaxID=2793064 RepID=A0ABS0N6Q9_9SPHN|nr:hypothetical protein [Aurantiacibacter sediminis]MBH5323451.1 hypothetical protein [Aurantiacibacter sediminis]
MLILVIVSQVAILLLQEIDFFKDDVEKLEEQAASRVLERPIIFYGSSTVAFWPDLDETLAPIPIYNHGFGGANSAQADFHDERLLSPYDPSMVVLYIGTNDIHGFSFNSADG